jgi:hypothetical protein
MNNITHVSNDPDAYKQYKSTDQIQSSLYDINFNCDASLNHQNRAIVFVDSRIRNDNEEPNKYNVRLKKEYFDVICIELVRAVVPNSQYIINNSNNCFYFQDSEDQLHASCGQPYHRIQLPVGNFVIDEFSHNHDDKLETIRHLLEIALNSVNHHNTYSVSIDRSARTVTISQNTGSGIFNILFLNPVLPKNENSNKLNPLPRNMGDILGFKTTSNKTHKTSYTGEYNYDLRPFKYVVLNVNKADKDWHRLDSNTDPIQNAFAILYLDSRFSNFQICNDCDKIDKEVYRLHFNPPIRRLDRLNIDFTDGTGTPCDFHGINNTLTFEITSLSRQTDYH